MVDVRTLSVKKYFALESPHVAARAFWIATATIVTAIAAQIEIPHQPVPYTFQTLVVILAGGLLGSKKGFLSMMAYLGLGAIGLPVFAGGGFGLARLMGPTGGYLLAFPVAAYLVGVLVSSRPESVAANSILNTLWLFGTMTLGLFIIFVMGTVQLNVVYFHNWTSAVQSGFLIFSFWDVMKLLAATAIVRELRKD